MSGSTIDIIEMHVSWLILDVLTGRCSSLADRLGTGGQGELRRDCAAMVATNDAQRGPLTQSEE
jgi:hypothetical protein